MGLHGSIFHDHQNCVLSYLRKGKSSLLICVHHFVPAFHAEYFIRLPHIAKMKEVFNTDREEFGGSGKINENIKISKRDLHSPLPLLQPKFSRSSFEQ